MNAQHFQAMYGYIPLEKASTGEGSRGGKIIGHTPSGKPIYDSQGSTSGGSSGRKPYPGEESHNMAPSEPAKRKTFMPKEGTEHHYTDSPNLKAYKTLMRAFKQQGVDFVGHISYDPKTDKMTALSPQGPALIRQVYDQYMKGKTVPKKEA